MVGLHSLLLLGVPLRGRRSSAADQHRHWTLAQNARRREIGNHHFVEARGCPLAWTAAAAVMSASLVGVIGLVGKWTERRMGARPMT